MSTYWHRFSLGSVLAALAWVSTAGGALTLYTEDSPATAPAIIIAPEACPIVRFAAQEMKRYLQRAGGVDAQVLTQRETTARPAIFIGESEATRALGVVAADLRPEGFVIRTTPGAVLIVGQDEQTADPLKHGPPHLYRAKGTLNGVYDFLERFLGIRWFFPGPMGEVVPRTPTLRLDDLEIVDYPRFSSRTIWPGTGLDLQELQLSPEELHLWYLRNRYGGSHEFVTNHSETKWAEKFGTEHPDWFALKKDGTRDNDPNDHYKGHLCYSSPGVFQQYVDEAKSFFAGRPTISLARDGFFCVMQNDSWSGCECAACQAQVDPDTGWSEQVWGMVAKVSEAVTPEAPQAKFCCCAYASYRDVPKTVRIPGNVYVRLCISSIFANPASKNPASKAAKRHAETFRQLDAWNRAVGDRTYIWSYFNQNDGTMPLGTAALSPHFVADHLRRFNGKAKGVFIEFSGWSYHVGDTYRGKKPGYPGVMPSWMLDHLNIYVSLRTLWNPDLDVDQLLADYHTRMFGQGAPAMQAFYDDLERIWVEDLLERDFVNDYVLWEQVYPEAVMKRFEGYLQQALAASAGVHRERVQFIRDWLYGEMATRRQEYVQRKGEIDARHILCQRVQNVGPITADKDKACWSQIQALGEFYDTKGNPAPIATTVKAAWDEENLYLLYVCEEPALERVNTRFQGMDLWKNDGVEVFLGPQGDGKEFSFFQIIADAAGKQLGLEIKNGKALPWQSEAEVAVHKEPAAYAVEIRIPFAALHVTTPKDDIIWRVNFCRNRWLDDAGSAFNASWCRLLGGFYKPDKFGRLVFREEP